MTNQELTDMFGGGFVIGNDETATELSFNDKVLTDNVLKFWAYDANMMPLPDFSTWNESYKDEVTSFVLGQTSSYDIDVWIDDTQIQWRDK